MKIPFPRVCLLALSAIALCALASCAKSQGRGDYVRVIYPGDPAPAWEGKAAGEVQPFDPVGETLKASLLAHPAPEVWLAFPPAAGQAHPQNTASGGDEPTAIRVNLPPEAVARLSAYWRETLLFRYELDIKGAGDGQSHMKMIDRLVYANNHAGGGLAEMQIDAPDGRRAISHGEARDVMTFINHSAQAIIEQAKEYKK